MPGIPRAMVLTVSFALSPGTGFLAPVASHHPARLGISVGMPGPHDFAVRHEISRPHKDRALTHRVHCIPRSTFVTIAKRPSCERETTRDTTFPDFQQNGSFGRVRIAGSSLKALANFDLVRAAVLGALASRVGAHPHKTR
jgi:hypothetical protein